jgi:alkanesulfonate monooxygenase SsuD/methylene tetrahydromethanopterin reductase-like flavin-dependent oxidoreductase (luciferase family)
MTDVEAETVSSMERTGIGFNPNLSPAMIAQYARIAEENNYDSLWVHEQPFIRDGITLLSSAISSTSRLKLGSGCVSVVTRHPLLASTTFAVLNEMSHGRAIMGVGLGGFPWLPKIGVDVFPVQQTKPMKRITEFLQITNGLLNGETVSFDGEFYKVTGIKLENKPAAKPPIYLATSGPRLLTHASKIADGVIISPALMTPEVTAEKVELVRKGEKSSRKIDVASYVLANVSNDALKAEAETKSYYFLVYQVAEVLKSETFASYDLDDEDLAGVREAWRRKDLAAAAKAMPDEVLDALTLTGKPDHCVERLRDYRKAGVDLPIVMPIGDVNAAIRAFAS